MNEQPQQNKKITVKHEFIMLALVFVAPILISWWLYANLDKWQQGGRNNGDLVEPARLLEDVDLVRKEGGSFKFSDLRISKAKNSPSITFESGYDPCWCNIFQLLSIF